MRQDSPGPDTYDHYQDYAQNNRGRVNVAVKNTLIATLQGQLESWHDVAVTHN